MNIKALVLVALALTAFVLSACSGSEPPTPTVGEVVITQYSSSPAMSIDAAKSYTATLKDQPRRDNNRALRLRCSDYRQQLPLPGPRKLLRRRYLPPRHRWVHDPGRRPHRHGDRRPGLQVPGRNRPFHHLRRARPAGHGQLGPRDQRQPVLHHRHPDTAPQWQSHHLRQGHRWLRRGARNLPAEHRAPGQTRRPSRHREHRHFRELMPTSPVR